MFSPKIPRSQRFENQRLVMMAEGFHTYPSRTRPLSPPAPMVLGPQGPGRVGRRQAKCKTLFYLRFSMKYLKALLYAGVAQLVEQLTCNQ